jgi:hypothetical protein
MPASSDEARDALIHCFQDAYHLKDWVKNDQPSNAAQVEQFIDEAPILRICADVCNGTKHLRLNNARTGDTSTAITSQSVTVRPGTIFARLGTKGQIQAATIESNSQPSLHSWQVSSLGKDYDAVGLADCVVHEWEAWLQAE